MNGNYSPKMKIMMEAVRKASRRLVRDHGEVEHLQISRKGTNDFVSSADIASEQIILEHLQRYYPDYGLLAEETGEKAGTDKQFRWILDPIDGTTNFIHGHPFFCISLALEQTLADGSNPEIIAAIVDAPALGETYYAEKGKGAFLEQTNKGGHTRLRVANRKKLEDCLIATGSYSDQPLIQQKALDTIQPRVASTRLSGAAALELAYVASGRFDMFIHHGLKQWDIAAGILLVREAGGVVTDYNNVNKLFNYQSVISGNEVVQYKTAKLIKNAISE